MIKCTDKIKEATGRKLRSWEGFSTLKRRFNEFLCIEQPAHYNKIKEENMPTHFNIIKA